MILSGIAFMVVTAGDTLVGTMFLIAGLVFLITGFIRHRKYGVDPESDERSRKIGAYGHSYGWLTGLFFMFCLFWLDFLGILKLGTQMVLVLSIVVLIFSARFYQVCLFRKGDVE
jgi:hypothetical protein